VAEKNISDYNSSASILSEKSEAAEKAYHDGFPQGSRSNHNHKGGVGCLNTRTRYNGKRLRLSGTRPIFLPKQILNSIAEAKKQLLLRRDLRHEFRPFRIDDRRNDAGGLLGGFPIPGGSVIGAG